MNQLAHIFITYIILNLFTSEAKEYFVFIVIFSIILDIDHLPGYFRMLFLDKVERNSMKIKDYVIMFRSILQEPLGILIIEAIIGLLYLFGIRNIILVIAAASIFIHWVIDFLTVHTKPFMPFNDGIFSLFFHTKKQRIISEVIITLISGIIFFVLWL
ncbi:hypothetical protein CMO89_01385 [Candidatus Woesearchaeota archaeon]|jgi:hypothetical protein|nr:hypothetical protein [Candidatus Woesearchaeota archaeon]|tara:strand:+ start:1346 stop:1819 length:474 start_codon:yes stop_codon:yes gene_type:complete